MTTTENTKKTAILYARVSTVRQAEEELPIESQLEQCHRKAQELGAEVVNVFRDDGKSGRYDSRPAFQEAISYSELLSPDYLITWSSSRFARNIDDSVIYKRRLKRAGVALVYVSLDVDTETIGGFALDHVMALFDDIYSRQVSADTIRSMMKNARDGYHNGGGVPLGYVSVPAEDNPKRKRLQIVPGEQEIVLDIFRLKAKGFGTRSIAMKLNDEGKLNRGRKWSKTTISALLRNHTVIGQVVFNKKCKKTGHQNPRDKWLLVDAHDPIIAFDLWDEVQKSMDLDTMTAGHSSAKSRWLFTGLLRCGSCGGSLQIETAKSGKYSYYNCRNYQRSGACRSHRVPAADLDEWLVDRIAAEVFNTENLLNLVSDLNEACSSWAAKKRQTRSNLLMSLEATKEKNRKLFEIMELMGKDTPNLGDLTRRLRENKSEIDRLENELLDLDSQSPPTPEVTQHDIENLSAVMVDIIKTSNKPKHIRQFFAGFIKEISLEGDQVQLEYLPQMILQGGKVPSAERWLPTPDILGTKLILFPLPKRFHYKPSRRCG